MRIPGEAGQDSGLIPSLLQYDKSSRSLRSVEANSV